MNERTVSSRAIYKGRILTLEELTVRLDDGSTALREIVRHRGAVAVLVRRVDGQWVLVRQYRKPNERIQLEVVAGGLEPGEEPDVCARREVREETGYEVVRLEPLGSIVASPGYCDEILHLFHAEVGDTPASTDLDEDERVQVVLMAEDDLVKAMAPGGEIQDGKTLATWLRYSLMKRAGGKGTR